MTPERYQRIKELFARVCDLPPGQRAAFLEQACGDDDDLRHEVETLLAHDDRTLPVKQRFSAAAALGLTGEQPRPPPQRGAPADPLPAQIGEFRIIRLIGQGGMGTVYEAEQSNPRRTIALKVIRPGIASEQVLRRFRFEAAVLGRLQHPGIAQIYQAGTATVRLTDGRTVEQPFFAMEYIRGRPLDEYAAARGLGTRARLGLLARICDAVHHAHQKGVIHRDLKPGNILVDERGQPKILDFGVARVTDADVQMTTLQTHVGQLIGTLPYMSPEQIAGDPHELDTRSDVYALGVICYQLLTGRLPCDLQGKTIPEAARLVAEAEPLPLSAVNRVFRGDLNTIVSKALEKDRRRRYQSACDLANDIRRFLADQPISARPATTMYQLRKFAQRNKAMVTVVVVAFVALVGALLRVTWERDRAIRAEQLAQQRLARIETETQNIRVINQFINDMLSAADPGHDGRDVRVADVLDRAAAGLAAQFENQPEVEAALRNTIGVTYTSLGLYQDAEPHLRRALALRRAALGEDDAQTLDSMTSLAGALKELGRLDEAEGLIRTTLAAARARRGPEDVETLRAANNLADILLKQGRLREAEQTWAAALAVQRRVLQRNDPLLLQTTNNLAQLLKRTNRPAEAEPLLRAALALQIENAGEEHPDTLVFMNNLSLVLQALGKLDEAEDILRKVIAIRRRTLGDHPATFTAISNLSRLISKRGRPAEAEEPARQALAGFEQYLGAENRMTLIARNNLASLLDELGRHDEADPLYRETLAVAKRALPPGHYMTLIFKRNHGGCLTALGRYQQAEPLLLSSYTGLKSALGPDNQHTRQALDNLITLYDRWGRPDEAARWRKVLAPEKP